MDIFIQNVPLRVNHVELRLFLTEIFSNFDIIVFDLVKKHGFNWALVTIARSEKALQFLACYGQRSAQRLIFRSVELRCKISNRKGQPEAIKVNALLSKEEEIRAKEANNPPKVLTSRSAQPTFAFQTLMTGVWEYDHHRKLVFDQKLKDRRQGFVTFGKYSLVIYLENAAHHEYNWPGRIDIQYATLEHVIPSAESGKRASIIFTLKSPPKIYMIQSVDNLHLYTGNDLPDMASLSMHQALSPKQAPRERSLERLCNLQHYHDKNSGLCMVYRLSFSSSRVAGRAWEFMKDYGVSGVNPWKIMIPLRLTGTIEAEYSAFDQALAHASFSFMEKFQLLALVLYGTITPTKAKELLSVISALSGKYESKIVARAIQRVGNQIPTPAPNIESLQFQIGSIQKALDTNIQHVKDAEAIYEAQHGRQRREHLALTCKVTITPTGMLLSGPDWTVSNRILRKYSNNSENFIRVFFADEDGLSVFHDPRASQKYVYDRFRKVLKDGITIAGRTFEFLGFSHSSLRFHQTWFMAPIFQDGHIVRAQDVIQGLGKFDMRCTAKCAARIGQAFSDTIFAVKIPETAHVVEDKDDVERYGRCFSDGCGTMSLELFQRVWKALPPDRREARPTVLQIRYRGAKGVVSLDTRLLGQQLHIRKSMTKYVASEGWRDLELCGANYRPLKMYLNHQFIKILEDQGVPMKNLIDVQNEARRNLEKIIQHPINAASFLEYSHSGVQAKVPRLLVLMHQIGISYQADRFLTDIVEVAAMSAVRDMKYRGRIPLEKGYLLYGIMDETNFLQEGEVYVTFQEFNPSGILKRNIILADRVLIGRAPALHPGDMQLVKAVNVPEGSPLRALSNCIVFSQQGQRDVPSQLSGGDLDGDLFHIIYDERLLPFCRPMPADYAAVPPQDLGRRVEVTDIANFFVDFMIMDQLGRISTSHKILADVKPEGTYDPECLVLAKLASDAVDFGKSGIPADESQMPKMNGRLRPDYMAPGHNYVINDVGATMLEEFVEEDIDEPDHISILDPDKPRMRFYKSEKVLGHLYRNIDERKFFDGMKNFFEAQRNSEHESLLQKLERYVDRETRGFQWDHHRAFAESLREYYEENMIDIMDSLRAHRRDQPLTELEVFSGNILGKKERATTRYIREANQDVQERFNRDVSAMIRNIINGNGEWENDNDSEALPRSIACWKVALETEGWENRVLIQSWKYVTAAVCLEQVSKHQGDSLRPL